MTLKSLVPHLCIVLGLAVHFPTVWTQTNEPILPKGITSWEMEQWLASPQSNLPQGLSRGIAEPPTGSNLRTAAEWEEVEVLTITWRSFPCILKQITAAAVQECRVVIFSEDVDQTQSYLTNNGCGGPVPMDSVEVVSAESNSIWIRDYGANTVYTEFYDGRVLVDWLYNRPRPDDDVIPDVLAAHMGIALHSTIEAPNDLMSTGGNWMSDGFGTAFSSELIFEENSGGPAISWGQQWGTYPDHDEAGIGNVVQAFHGTDTYVKMNVLPHDGIHHIDMHMKLLNESTLLVSEYPSGVADGPQIEANLQYVLSNFTTRWGTPFNVIRIPSPPQLGGGFPHQGGDYLTYSNATFVNKTILLPTYYEQYDTTAIRIWEEAMPGYNVVGIDCDSPSENIIAQSGAIHCITHTVAIEDPLMISHLPLEDTEDSQNSYVVRADVGHRTGIQEVSLNWAISEAGPWTEVPMTASAASTPLTEYTAAIPAQPEGTKVHYYISAIAENGKSGSRPMPAPEGWWAFRVLAEGTGLDNPQAESPWHAIYPNPARALTCLEVNLPRETECTVTLHNSMGQPLDILHQGTLQRGIQRLFVDAGQLASGPYLVTLTTGNGQRWSERLLVAE